MTSGHDDKPNPEYQLPEALRAATKRLPESEWHVRGLMKMAADRLATLEARCASSVTAPTSGAYRWIEDAAKLLRESGKQTGNEWCDRRDRLLAGVPCQQEDLGFNSPADRAAQSSIAPIETEALAKEIDKQIAPYSHMTNTSIRYEVRLRPAQWAKVTQAMRSTPSATQNSLEDRIRAEFAIHPDDSVIETLRNRLMARSAIEPRYEALWKHCKVIFYRPGDMSFYPIEHAPQANKDSRWLIEAELEKLNSADGGGAHG